MRFYSVLFWAPYLQPTAHAAKTSARLDELEHGDPTVGWFHWSLCACNDCGLCAPCNDFGRYSTTTCQCLWAYGQYGKAPYFSMTLTRSFDRLVSGRGNFSASEVKVGKDVEQRVFGVPVFDQ